MDHVIDHKHEVEPERIVFEDYSAVIFCGCVGESIPMQESEEKDETFYKEIECDYTENMRLEPTVEIKGSNNKKDISTSSVKDVIEKIQESIGKVEDIDEIIGMSTKSGDVKVSLESFTTDVPNSSVRVYVRYDSEEYIVKYRYDNQSIQS